MRTLPLIEIKKIKSKLIDLMSSSREVRSKTNLLFDDTYRSRFMLEILNMELEIIEETREKKLFLVDKTGKRLDFPFASKKGNQPFTFGYPGVASEIMLDMLYTYLHQIKIKKPYAEFLEKAGFDAFLKEFSNRMVANHMFKDDKGIVRFKKGTIFYHPEEGVKDTQLLNLIKLIN